MNRLHQETSPYLKQHETNPVDWFPWSEEALKKSREENKPILLSVGYSACHWCHVMAHECFENEEIAKVMNAHFVCIKVDREERPDLDQIYQNVAQAMTGGGGWPLTVFLLPDLRPFYGGTYFPPTDRYGRPGFKRLLEALSGAYQNDQTSIEENAAKLTQIIKELEEGKKPAPLTDLGSQPIQKLLVVSAENLLSNVDWHRGGMGSAPKFPNPMTFTFLWRMSESGLLDGSSNGGLKESARQAVLLTLTQMAQGGIFDQLGGGFSRYSVDESWSVPHFEKMLYDNGLLLGLYSEVLIKKDLPAQTHDLFLETVRSTVAYVLREMTDPENGFYAAQDADSEGEEGKFFAWDKKDLAQVLNEKDLSWFVDFYGVSDAGNFEHGKTVLYRARPDLTLDARIRDQIFLAREKRVKPGLDDKVIVSWNALMISGLVFASHALKETDPELSERAKITAIQVFDQVITKAMNLNYRLCATIQKGSPKGSGFLDDYAFMAKAALDLARFSQKTEYYENLAHRWSEIIDHHFKDQKGVGFYFTSDDQEKLIQRPKSIHDQAIPSGVAVALNVMQVFQDLKEVADQQLDALTGLIEKNPFGYSELLTAILQREVGVATLTPGLEHALRFHPQVYTLGKMEAEVVFCHREVCQKLDLNHTTQKMRLAPFKMGTEA
jgi:uncharacterized protein YyaL (SSP411 family)